MAKSTSLGTELFMETDTPGTYVKIGNVVNVGVPGPERTEIDATDLDSDAEESLPGFVNYGELAFTVNLNLADPGQIAFFDDAQDPAAGTRGFRIDMAQQDTRFEFDGYPRRFRPNAAGPRAMATADGAIRVSGAVTRTTPIPADV